MPTWYQDDIAPCAGAPARTLTCRSVVPTAIAPVACRHHHALAYCAGDSAAYAAVRRFATSAPVTKGMDAAVAAGRRRGVRVWRNEMAGDLIFGVGVARKAAE